ncbi:MAG: hypothetical protein MJK04_09250 [Psychrosphaera sp.]|nr:hypothetical protein [Psychrosphaera sp.]
MNQQTDATPASISRWRRKWQATVTVAASLSVVIITFGQYKDAKELSGELFDSWLSKFTHEVEYKKLAVLKVGITRQYLQTHLGQPKVIKASSIQFGMTFEYYLHDKYLLSAFMKGDRLNCYSVLSLLPSFKPAIPFGKNKLNSRTMATLLTNPANEYVSDAVNLKYFLQQEPLGKAGLYMNRSIGVIHYFEVKGPKKERPVQQNSVLQNGFGKILERLEEAQVEGNITFENKILTRINDVYPANFFAVCEWPLTVVAEAVLTRYEYQQLK